MFYMFFTQSTVPVAPHPPSQKHNPSHPAILVPLFLHMYVHILPSKSFAFPHLVYPDMKHRAITLITLTVANDTDHPQSTLYITTICLEIQDFKMEPEFCALCKISPEQTSSR